MSGFNDRFGGSTLKPVNVSYRDIALSANVVLQWPEFATDENVVARAMNVTPSGATFKINMPDATLSSPGDSFIWYNSGSFQYTVADSAGTPIATIQPGERRYIELTNNSTTAGAWLVTLLGVGTGSLDVAAAAGEGLKAIGTTLNVAFPVVTVNSSRAVTAADRDTVLVWTGGAGTLTFPASGSVPDLNVEVRNQGTGALTLAMTGGELIDGVASLIFNNTESAWVHAGTGAYYTVGRGRNAQFNFTQLVKTVTGGTVVETLTEAANVVQTFIGALVANVDIVLPSVVQVYYVSNQTTGAFNLRFKNAAVGSTVPLPQGQNAVIFSDGTNVINASTTIAGIGAITFGAGTAATPSVQIGAVNTGFFSPGSGSVAFSSGGTSTFVMNAAGALVSLATNALLGVTSTGGTAFVAASRPAGAEAGMQINTVNSPRWIVGASSAPESGANAGSDWQIKRFDDAGVLIDTPVSINRATGVVTVASGVRDLSAIGRVEFFISDAVVKPFYLKLNGALVSRTTYADLFAYATASGLVSEAAWSGGQSGRFSVGDGSTTFRLPDIRGVFVRGLDDGRGLDVGRLWGTFQDQINLAHTHTVTDPTHNHAHSDPTHQHGYSDPTHQHGGSTTVAGSHAHNVFSVMSFTGGVAQNGFGWNQYTPTNNTTDAQGDHAHGVVTDFRGVGITISFAATGMSNVATSTGISLVSNGAADGHPRNVAYPAYIRYS